jgi:hypothetical protein
VEGSAIDGPARRTGENPPYGILGEVLETSAFETRSAPLPYPTVNALVRICAGAIRDGPPYRDTEPYASLRGPGHFPVIPQSSSETSRKMVACNRARGFPTSGLRDS